jgi:hypothetical protein
MINTKKKDMKRFTYVCLSFASILLSTELQALSSSSEDYENDDRIRYNLVGVALFSGTDLVSKTIKKVTHSKISHVGVILADARDENKWYCFESTGTPDEVLHGYYPHVRVTPWEDTVEEYDGKVSYRLAVFEDRDRTDSRAVTQFVEEYDGKSYTKNPLKLFRALFRKNKESTSEPLNTVFCSELAAKMLMNLEIIDRDIASNKLPKDFSSGGNIIPKLGITFTEAFPADYVVL